MAKATCPICKLKVDTKLMIKEKDNKYYHLNVCHQKYLDKKKLAEKEQNQKDKLYKTIMRIHGLKNSQEIPTLFYMKVEEVRNNSGLLGRYDKKYKEGVPYSGIDYTYDYCIDDINKALYTKSEESLLSKMNYCFGIVRNNIVDAFINVRNVNKQKENVAKLVENIDASNEVNEKIKNAQIRNKQSENESIDLASLFD